jgi:hypothetical protein
MKTTKSVLPRNVAIIGQQPVTPRTKTATIAPAPDKFEKRRKVSITIGVGKDKEGADITEQQVTEKLATTGKLVFVRGFGGFTLTTNAGGWAAPSGELIVENSVTVSIVTDSLNIGVFRQTVTALAGELRDLFNQSCVLVEIAEVDAAII